MRKKTLYSIFTTCKTFNITPSNHLKIWDEWAAYQFDNAVAYFGNWIENMLAEYDEHTKQQKYTLQELLTDYNEDNNEITYEDNLATTSYLQSLPGSVKVIDMTKRKKRKENQ